VTPKAKGALIDQEDTAGRTTSTLVAALASRLATLHFVSGADAIASLTSGFAALGAEVSKTAAGAKLRHALSASRVASNGEAIWGALQIGENASSATPTPVLEQLRNDVALLLADDLENVIDLLPIPPGVSTAPLSRPPETVTFMDFIIGYWTFSKEMVAALEFLAQLGSSPHVEAAATANPTLSGSILR
jgi:hypothetical protein